MAEGAAQERLHYMDHLRALAMLAGVFFHAALAYSPLMQPYWPLADRETSVGVDALAWGLHLVRMPLFFLVAGFFAAWLVTRRGGVGFARQRVRRLLLPLLVAWPLVAWSLAASTGWATEHVQHPSPMLLWLREWLQQPDRPRSPPGTAHLWFLYYLLLFALLHGVVRTLGWGRIGRAAMQARPAWVVWGLPALLAPALASVSAPHPAPEGWLPQFWAIGFYGAFYALGVAVHDHPGWLLRLRSAAGWLVPGCALAYLLFLWQLGRLPPAETAPWSTAALEACLAVWLTLGGLLAGQRWLDRPRPLMRYLAQSAYWTYLLHLPILFALQYLLMDQAWPWPAKFLLASLGTVGVCLASYHALVRHSPLRRFVG